MFERFKKTRDAESPAYGQAGSTVQERDARDEQPTTVQDHDGDGIRDDREQGIRDDREQGIRDEQPRTAQDRDGDGIRDDREQGIRDEQPRAAQDRDGDGIRDDRERDHPGRGKAVAAGAAGAAVGAAAEHHHERKRDRDGDGIPDNQERGGVTGRGRDRDRDGIPDDQERGRTRAGAVEERDGVRRHAPLMEAEAMSSVRRRQRAEFGGMSWGSAFFGWLSAVGLAAILTSILVAAGAAIGLNQVKDAANNDTNTIGLAGGIALLLVLAIAWYAGGYVAGRMARFDGARQGFAVWLWTLLFILVAAAAAVIGGTQYDIANQLNLPSIPTGNQTLTTGGAIAAGAALLVTLLFAVIGGKAGDRFHRRVDRVATDHYEEVV